MMFNILFRSYDFSNTYLFEQITFLTFVIRKYDLRKHDIRRHDPLPCIHPPKLTLNSFKRPRMIPWSRCLYYYTVFSVWVFYHNNYFLDFHIAKTAHLHVFMNYVIQTQFLHVTTDNNHQYRDCSKRNVTKNQIVYHIKKYYVTPCAPWVTTSNSFFFCIMYHVKVIKFNQINVKTIND
jgi:hypothetical protein